MRNAENIDLRVLAEAELDAVGGGILIAAVAGVGLFGLGMIIGMSGCWEPVPAGAPKTLDALYASWG
jgi:hypothetical protein